MTAISFPTNPSPNGMTPFLKDFGGTLVPFLGGPEQLIVRAGTRFGAKISLPPIRSDELGRIYVSRLLQGRMYGALMRWPLIDFDPGNPGTPLINTAVSTGSTISIKGLSSGYVIKEGQYFSVIAGGKRYLHMATANASEVAGVATVSIFPMLRRNLSVNDVVELAQPMIEGLISPGDELAWEIAADRHMSISFKISESA